MFKNQRGVGLIAVLIASGLVVLLALAVGRFITQFNQQSIRTENSAACQSIAKDIVEYFKKDDNALFITSVGPDPVTKKFPTGIVNEDGVERFSLNGGDVYSGAGLITGVASSVAILPNTATFYNYLNYRNSFNRLLALAYSQGKCCTDANSCNSLLYDSSNPTSNPPGLKLVNNGNPFQVFLGVNPIENGTSLCSGTTPSRLVDPRASSIQMEFYVRVVNNPTDSQKRSQCIASGQVQFPRDAVAPLTILSLDTSSFCGAGKTKPSMCLRTPPATPDPNVVTYTVHTVRSTTSCNNCLGGLRAYTCGQPNNYPLATCGAACQTSDPGSVFLCRAGEKNWFAENPDKWEPCESAHVYAKSPVAGDPPVVVGSVSISYAGSASPANKTRQIGTEATITLSGLSPQKAYLLDVRAVDGGGQLLGQSFCYANPNCDQPHIIVSNGPPTTNSVTPNDSSIIGLATDNQLGSSQRPAGRYNPAMTSFGTGKFQCSIQSKPLFVDSYSYGSGVSPLNIENGTYQITPPAGASSNPMTCSDGTCTFQDGPAPGDPDGNYSVVATVGNECFPVGTSASYGWCLDTKTSFSAVSTSGQYNSTLLAPGTGITGKTSVSGKACGIAFARPTLAPGTPDFTFSMINTGSPLRDNFTPASMGWLASTNSGCVERTNTSQYCIRAFDPCGRGVNSKEANNTVAEYSSTLAETPTTNSCGGGSFGNSCDSGLFCSSVNLCRSRSLPYATATFGDNRCNNDGDCVDANDCTTHGYQGFCQTTYNCVSGTYSRAASLCTAPTSSGSGCTIDYGSCSGTCQGSSSTSCASDAVCGSNGPCVNKKCSSNSSINCSADNDCKISGDCQYAGGSPGTCERPTNLTCGSTRIDSYCPDLNSCTSSVPSCPSGYVNDGNGNCVPLPPFVCTGSVPANATFCPGSNLGLTADTPIILAANCQNFKCAYKCNTGYVLEVPATGNPFCKLAEYNCTGNAPSHATLCMGSDQGLTIDMPRTLVSSCTGGKCEYTCDSGFPYENGVCKTSNPTCTGSVPANATLCSGSDQGLTADTPRSVYDFCGANKCAYTCTGMYVNDNGSCVRVAPPGLCGNEGCCDKYNNDPRCSCSVMQSGCMVTCQGGGTIYYLCL